MDKLAVLADSAYDAPSSPPPISERENGKLFRKLDWHLLPIMTVLFTFSFIDRANIGTALSLGLVKDLHLEVGVRANIVAATFFIGYAAFQIPSQIVLKLTRPSLWLPFTMFVWGMVLSLSCLVKSYESLVVARFFLGVAEAGIVPGSVFYLSFWYPRHCIARRCAFLLNTGALGIAWGGILAYGFSRLEGRGALHGWAWIFAIEGVLTCVVAVAAFFLMHDFPEHASFLMNEERSQLLAILAEDRKGAPTSFKWAYVQQALYDWKVYILGILYICILGNVYNCSLFLPSVIRDLGYGAANAQLLIVPPYALAWPISFYLCHLSDRFRLRGPFLVLSSSVSMIGFGILRSSLGAGKIGYVGAFFAVIGSGCLPPLIAAWVASNAGGDTKRAASLGLTVGCSPIGGIISSFVYRQRDAPYYHLGHDVALGMAGCTIVCSLFMIAVYRHLNAEKTKRCKTENPSETDKAAYSHLNDDSPFFIYML